MMKCLKYLNINVFSILSCHLKSCLLRENSLNVASKSQAHTSNTTTALLQHTFNLDNTQSPWHNTWIKNTAEQKIRKLYDKFLLHSIIMTLNLTTVAAAATGNRQPIVTKVTWQHYLDCFQHVYSTTVQRYRLFAL